jgi:hypothetical protein
VIEFQNFENYLHKFLQFQLIVHFLIYIIYYQNEVKVVLGQLNYPLISDLNQTITNKYKLLTNDGFSFPGYLLLTKKV